MGNEGEKWGKIGENFARHTRCTPGALTYSNWSSLTLPICCPGRGGGGGGAAQGGKTRKDPQGWHWKYSCLGFHPILPVSTPFHTLFAHFHHIYSFLG